MQCHSLTRNSSLRPKTSHTLKWTYMFCLLVATLIVQEQKSTHGMSIFNKAVTRNTFSWTNYPEYSEIKLFMKHIAKTHSGFVSLESIGKSFEGRKMLLLKVCSGQCGHKPMMWIDGGMHGRELLSPVTVLYTIKELVERRAEHPELVEKLDWYFLPVSNPDGYVFNQPFLTKCVDDFRKIWRKNRQPNTNNSSCIGTDLNRNWNFKHENEIFEKELVKNMDLSEIYSLKNIVPKQKPVDSMPCENSYEGLTPFSAPETMNMKKFLYKNKGKIKFFNTVHCCAQILLMPWGHTRIPIENIEDLDRFAKKAIGAINEYHHSKLIEHLVRLELADKLPNFSIIHKNQLITCAVDQKSKQSNCMTGRELKFQRYSFSKQFQGSRTLVIGIGTRFGNLERSVNIDTIPQRELLIKYLILIGTNQNSKNTLTSVKEGSIYLGIVSATGKAKYFTTIYEINEYGVMSELIRNTYQRTYQVGPVVPKFSKEAIPGTALDWAYGVARIPYSFTLELMRDKQTRYAMPSQDYIKSSGEEIWAFHQAAAAQIISEFS